MTITQNKLALHLAAELNGREYDKEITDAEAASARRDGLVVVFGASDDLMEFRGAITDEVGVGSATFISRTGIVSNECEDSACPYHARAKAAAAPIMPLGAEPEFDFVFETAIPHATFVIVYRGEPYCRGIVFALEDVPA